MQGIETRKWKGGIYNIMLEVKTFVLGAIKTNCYFIKDTDTGICGIIDPGGISLKLDESINEAGKEKVKYIILTHGHFDHILKAKRYQDYTGAKIIIGEYEVEFTENSQLNLSSGFKRSLIKPFKADIAAKDGDVFDLGNTSIKAIHTPGHTRGGMCYIANDIMFSGDTIMKDHFGRTDFITGSFEDLKKSIDKLKSLNEDYIVYPGHGEKTRLLSEIIE